MPRLTLYSQAIPVGAWAGLRIGARPGAVFATYVVVPRDRRNNLRPIKARFDRLGELSDLECAISTLSLGVDLTPHGHPDRPACLTNLGNSLITRFDHLGVLSDLEDAISGHRDAVDLTPHDHPDRPACLNNLGNSLFTRFERLGELGDLEHAISSHRDAVDATSRGHPDKPV